VVFTLTKAHTDLQDMGDLFDMAKEEGDDDTLEALIVDAEEVRKVIEGMEFRRMFNNPMDPNNCFIDIQAGAGGTEAQDWASMLLRQYLRYANAKASRSKSWNSRTARWPASRRHHQGGRRIRLRLPAHGNRRAPSGAQIAVRLVQRPPHLVHVAVRVSGSG
jgi:hypothetical protein